MTKLHFTLISLREILKIATVSRNAKKDKVIST